MYSMQLTHCKKPTPASVPAQSPAGVTGQAVMEQHGGTCSSMLISSGLSQQQQQLPLLPQHRSSCVMSQSQTFMAHWYSNWNLALTANNTAPSTCPTSCSYSSPKYEFANRSKSALTCERSCEQSCEHVCVEVVMCGDVCCVVVWVSIVLRQWWPAVRVTEAHKIAHMCVHMFAHMTVHMTVAPRHTQSLPQHTQSAPQHTPHQHTPPQHTQSAPQHTQSAPHLLESQQVLINASTQHIAPSAALPRRPPGPSPGTLRSPANTCKETYQPADGALEK